MGEIINLAEQRKARQSKEVDAFLLSLALMVAWLQLGVALANVVRNFYQAQE